MLCVGKLPSQPSPAVNFSSSPTPPADPLCAPTPHPRSGIEMSPIRIVKNPDGSMQRAAMTQSALAKERRELKEQQQRTLLDAIPKDLSRPWEVNRGGSIVSVWTCLSCSLHTFRLSQQCWARQAVRRLMGADPCMGGAKGRHPVTHRGGRVG